MVSSKLSSLGEQSSTDGSYTITAGSVDTAGTITARLEVYKELDAGGNGSSSIYFEVTLYKEDGSYYITDVARSYKCSATGYVWSTGTKTLSMTLTIPINNYRVKEKYATVFNYDISNPKFDATQSNTLYFEVGGAAAGFIINCDLLPTEDLKASVGTLDLRFKRICCEELICSKINGQSQG